jgi:hypothetical protein
MRKESGERARRLRTPRFVLQVVKDQAVGSEGGYAARLALGDGAHLVGVLAPLRRREAVEAQAVAASEDVVSKLGVSSSPYATGVGIRPTNSGWRSSGVTASAIHCGIGP